MTGTTEEGGFETRPYGPEPMKNKPSTRRRPLRLPTHDYARPGAYFVTVCTLHRFCRFGNIRDGAMRRNRCGQAVGACWHALPAHYRHLALDSFVVMPNHIHGIFVLRPVEDRSADKNVKRHALPEIVRAFKTFSTRQINDARNTPGVPLWQRGYYEHVIRDDLSLNRLREYIANNPAKWAFDRENPDRPCRRGGFQTRPVADFSRPDC